MFKYLLSGINYDWCNVLDWVTKVWRSIKYPCISVSPGLAIRRAFSIYLGLIFVSFWTLFHLSFKCLNPQWLSTFLSQRGQPLFRWFRVKYFSSSIIQQRVNQGKWNLVTGGFLFFLFDSLLSKDRLFLLAYNSPKNTYSWVDFYVNSAVLVYPPIFGLPVCLIV